MGICYDIASNLKNRTGLHVTCWETVSGYKPYSEFWGVCSYNIDYGLFSTSIHSDWISEHSYNELKGRVTEELTEQILTQAAQHYACILMGVPEE